MINSKIKKIIKKFRTIPIDLAWLKQSQEQMIEFMEINPVRKIELDRRIMAQGFFYNFKLLILKPMPIAIIAIIISLATGSGVVTASQNSLPTDALYPIKIATEQIQEAMTFDNNKKVDLSVKLAEKRLEEIKQMQTKEQVPTQAIEETLIKYEKYLTNAQNQLANISGNNTALKTIATAVKYENSLERQQEKLAILTSQASQTSVESQPSFDQAQKANIASSNQTLEKIETKIQETEVSQGDTSSASGSISPKIETISGTIPKYIDNIDEKTNNRINTAENKLAEIRKKINNFSAQNETKCSLEQKKTHIEKLENNYQDIQAILIKARESFDQGSYFASLNLANQAMTSTIDNDNLVGQWRSECGSADITSIACAMLFCNGRNAYPTGEFYEDGCPIYKCPKNECKMIFSNCSCANKCVEIIEGQGTTDCMRACSLNEINDYKPNCGYQNGLCQDLNIAKRCPEIAVDCVTGSTPIQNGINKNGCPIWTCQPVTIPISNQTNTCPSLAPLPPDWCKNGKIYPGDTDTNGCHGTPRCVTYEIDEATGSTNQTETQQKIESSQSKTGNSTQTAPSENSAFDSILKFLQIK